jgi:hypothetical protein
MAVRTYWVFQIFTRRGARDVLSTGIDRRRILHEPQPLFTTRCPLHFSSPQPDSKAFNLAPPLPYLISILYVFLPSIFYISYLLVLVTS